MLTKHQLQNTIIANVRSALEEDIQDGDITAALIDLEAQATATIITREPGVLSGKLWAEESFQQVDSEITMVWQSDDGDALTENQILVTLSGSARSLLTAERTALNFLQTLSGTATTCQHYASIIKGTDAKLLDTRKTIPGLRLAQKHAVTHGGCYNHRIGLYDAFLIKENHIMACGSIANAVNTAKQQAPGKPIEVEVESLDQLQEALDCQADSTLLDNFSIEMLEQAVSLAKGEIILEASGNVDENNLRSIAETGVDYISIGALTKHVRALDLSMRLI